METIILTSKRNSFMLIIINNQNAFIKKFENNFLAHQNFEYAFFDHNQPIDIPENKAISGVILSGGKGTPYRPLNLTANFVALMNYNVPTLGFCLGHEIIAVSYGGQISKTFEYHTRKTPIKIKKTDDPIFEGYNTSEISLTRRHHYHVSLLPQDFICLAESEISPNEIIRHKSKPIYGFQAHPEVSGNDGLVIINNFLRMCGLL